MTRPLLVASLVALLTAPTLAQPPPPGQLRVDLEVDVETDGDAVFRWRLEPAQEATCTLDADGDGIFEHGVEDCDADRSLRHSYDAEGTYHAVLVARTHDGRSGRARVTATID